MLVAGMLVAGMRIIFSKQRTVTKCTLMDTELRIVDSVSVESETDRLDAATRARCYAICIEKLGIKPNIIMILDYGWYYPNNDGPAVILQNMLDIPTVGISRRFIPTCGIVPEIMEKVAWISEDRIYCFGNDSPLGAIINIDKKKKPLIISPGQQVDQDGMLRWARLVDLFILPGDNLPSPLMFKQVAHLISQE